MIPPAVRQFAMGNPLGCRTLCRRGMVRFLRYSWTTVGGVCVSSLLLLTVFQIAGRGGAIASGLDVVGFIAPGVVLLASSITAFESAAVLIIEDKMEGSIADVLMAPLSSLEILAGFLLPALAHALLASGAVFLLTLPFTDYSWQAVWQVPAFLVLNALVFCLIGGLIGLWAEKWDNYGAAEAFLILPLGFLSGGFFSTVTLPEAARALVQLNPLFHAVNGLRGGLTGYYEGSVWVGLLLLACVALVLGLLFWRLIACGYKVKL